MDMPVDVIETRLRAWSLTWSCAFLGATSRPINPVHEWPHYIVIEITGPEAKKPGKFPEPGFYVVLDLLAPAAEFLFAPIPTVKRYYSKSAKLIGNAAPAEMLNEVFPSIEAALKAPLREGTTFAAIPVDDKHRHVYSKTTGWELNRPI
jgi:hypothetical protein